MSSSLSSRALPGAITVWTVWSCSWTWRAGEMKQTLPSKKVHPGLLFGLFGGSHWRLEGVARVIGRACDESAQDHVTLSRPIGAASDHERRRTDQCVHAPEWVASRRKGCILDPICQNPAAQINRHGSPQANLSQIHATQALKLDPLAAAPLNNNKSLPITPIHVSRPTHGCWDEKLPTGRRGVLRDGAAMSKLTKQVLLFSSSSREHHQHCFWPIVLSTDRAVPFSSSRKHRSSHAQGDRR